MRKYKKSFNKKESVRFILKPGPEKDGKPTTYFQPLQTAKNNKLTPKQKRDLIKQLTGQDYDCIQINGEDLDEKNIPSFVLQQIRSMKGLVFNQKNNQDYEEGLEDYNQNEHDWNQQEDFDGSIQEEEQIIDEDDQDWESDSDQHQQNQNEKQEQNKFELKQQDFPTLQKTETLEFQGILYNLTPSQIELLNCVIPDNYEKLNIKGVNFKKYNEDGLSLQQKQKYQQFIAGENRAVVDSYQYTPPIPINFVDNDLKPSQIKGQMKEIEEALNYEGQQQLYEELQDDFFVKLIQGTHQQVEKPITKPVPPTQKKYKKPAQQAKNNLQTKQIKQKFYEEAVITDQMLEKALKQFQTGQEIQSQRKQSRKSSEGAFDIQELEKMQKNIGPDGQLDWRTLTQRQKKLYMKNKKIKDFYDQLRQREIAQKMKDKVNVKVEELHLKNRIKHINFQDDHVMQSALLRDDEVDDKDQEPFFETESSDDDIISYRAKTSIIATNLSVIQEPKRIKNNIAKGSNQNGAQKNIEKPKCILEKRNRNQTKEEKKQRKQLLKKMKKAKKQFKKQFANQFQTHKQISMKKNQPNNPLYQISMVKII